MAVSGLDHKAPCRAPAGPGESPLGAFVILLLGQAVGLGCEPSLFDSETNRELSRRSHTSVRAGCQRRIR